MNITPADADASQQRHRDVCGAPKFTAVINNSARCSERVYSSVTPWPVCICSQLGAEWRNMTRASRRFYPSLNGTRKTCESLPVVWIPQKHCKLMVLAPNTVFLMILIHSLNFADAPPTSLSGKADVCFLALSFSQPSTYLNALPHPLSQTKQRCCFHSLISISDYADPGECERVSLWPPSQGREGYS